MTRLLHGGRLHAAALHYGGNVADWLDLSCALNPEPWPVPALPLDVFARLPDDDDGLLESAAAFYGTRHLLLLPGSQTAIAMLPRITGRSHRVWVPDCGYAEHAHCWARAGHQLQRYDTLPSPETLRRHDVVVCIRPHNPLADCTDRQTLQDLHERLSTLEGLLVVDEAFIDATPEASLIVADMPEHLVVLRSFGKFFGLAGLRLGAIAAAPRWLNRMDEGLEPWCINSPARYIARLAYADRSWHHAARARLCRASRALAEQLQTRLSVRPEQIKTCALFVTLQLGETHATALHDALARQAILVRIFKHEGLLRFGLPPGTAGVQRLDNALLTL